MKKVVPILFVFSVIFSGCIISGSPSAGTVFVYPGNTKTFSVKTFPSNDNIVWFLDGEEVQSAGTTFTYTALDDGIMSHTLVARELNSFGKDTYEWNISSDYNTDDAIHIDFPVNNPEADFEWWYFDAALDNGDHFVSMFSVNDVRLLPRQPSVRTNIYEANGNEIKEINIYDESQVSFSYERCDVTEGVNFIIDQGYYYELYTNINGNGAHLRFYPLHPSWSRSPSRLLHMGWTIAIPYGTVEGVLIKNGEEIPVSGQGYHDHNWGTTPMEMDHWYWGKVHTEDISVDYVILIPEIGGAPITGVLITDENGVIAEPDIVTSLLNIRTELNDIQHEPIMGLDFANQLVIDVIKIGEFFEMSLTIEMDHIVMMDEAQFTPSQSAYRYIGNETMAVKRSGKTKTYNTHSLHEVVYNIE